MSGKFPQLMSQLDDVLENVTPAQRETFLTKSLEGMIKRYEATPPRFATSAEKRFQTDLSAHKETLARYRRSRES
jgi:hypothetical protein